MASQTGEIQQLLVAEKKAADKVGEAKKRKAKRLKQAKDEAQVKKKSEKVRYYIDDIKKFLE
jgi:V-type H+-transporting ATPase subunit G